SIAQDAIIPRICDPHETISIDRNARCQTDFRRPASKSAPGPNKFSGGSKLDHTVSFRVCHIYIFICVDSDKGFIFQRLTEPSTNVPLRGWNIEITCLAG